MKIAPKKHVFIALFLAFLMSGVPASATTGMISTRDAVAELSRTQTIERIERYIARSEVRAEMLKHGLEPGDVQVRLASMKNSELKQISDRVTGAQAGGEVVVIGLGTVLLVVIILLLMGRI